MVATFLNFLRSLVTLAFEGIAYLFIILFFANAFLNCYQLAFSEALLNFLGGVIIYLSLNFKAEIIIEDDIPQ